MEGTSLTRDDIIIDRELIVFDNGISAYIETLFDVDEKFSLTTKGHADTSVNFYALFNPDTEDVTCSYMVRDNESDTEHTYLPTAEETILIKTMMEETCLKEYGCDLIGLWTESKSI